MDLDASCLVSTYLDIYQINIFLLFISSWIPYGLRKYFVYFLLFLKVFYGWECSLCTWEEWVFCCCWSQCSRNVRWDKLVDELFWSSMSLLSLLLLVLSVSERGMLKSSTKIEGLSISPIITSFCLVYFEVCCWVHVHLRLLYFLGELVFLHNIISSLSLIMLPVMKSTLSTVNVNTLLVYAWYIFLHHFIFNLNMPLYLKWVSHRLNTLEFFTFFFLSQFWSFVF